MTTDASALRVELKAEDLGFRVPPGYERAVRFGAYWTMIISPYMILYLILVILSGLQNDFRGNGCHPGVCRKLSGCLHRDRHPGWAFPRPVICDRDRAVHDPARGLPGAGKPDPCLRRLANADGIYQGYDFVFRIPQPGLGLSCCRSVIAGRLYSGCKCFRWIAFRPAVDGFLRCDVCMDFGLPPASVHEPAAPGALAGLDHGSRHPGAGSGIFAGGILISVLALPAWTVDAAPHQAMDIHNG